MLVDIFINFIIMIISVPQPQFKDIFEENLNFSLEILGCKRATIIIKIIMKCLV